MEEGVSWVRAVDSFIAQNETDLGFKEGDLIQLLRFADENWAVGKLLNGAKQGIFPICFTEPHKGPPPTATPNRPTNESDRNNGIENGDQKKINILPDKIAKSGLNGIIIDHSNELGTFIGNNKPHFHLHYDLSSRLTSIYSRFQSLEQRLKFYLKKIQVIG